MNMHNTMNLVARGHHTPVCISPLMLAYSAPEHTVLTAQCKKVTRTRRAMVFLLCSYTLAEVFPVKQLKRAGVCWARGAVYS